MSFARCWNGEMWTPLVVEEYLSSKSKVFDGQSWQTLKDDDQLYCGGDRGWLPLGDGSTYFDGSWGWGQADIILTPVEFEAFTEEQFNQMEIRYRTLPDSNYHFSTEPYLSLQPSTGRVYLSFNLELSGYDLYDNRPSYIMIVYYCPFKHTAMFSPQYGGYDENGNAYGYFGARFGSDSPFLVQ